MSKNVIQMGVYLITQTEDGIRISDISNDGVMVVRPTCGNSVEIFDKWKTVRNHDAKKTVKKDER